MDIDQAVKAYLDAKQFELTSANSLRNLRYFVNDWIAPGFRMQLPRAELDQLTAVDLRRLITWWESGSTGRTIRPSTIKKVVKHLKSLFNWLEQEQLLAGNPGRPLRYKPRERGRATARIPRAHLKRLQQAAQGDDFGAKLCRAVMGLLLDTGIRAAELCALKDEDVRLGDQQIHLRAAKGGAVGTIGFGKSTQYALRSYLDTREKLSAQRDERMFLNSRGAQLTERHLYKLLSVLSDRAGIPRVHPHMFRVTFAVEQFHAGASILEVQTALRHASVDMTLRYFRLYQQEKTAMACLLHSVADGLLGM